MVRVSHLHHCVPGQYAKRTVMVTVEANFAALVIMILCWVCAQLNIPVILPCLAGSSACAHSYKSFSSEMMHFVVTKHQKSICRHVHVTENGMHFSNMKYWRYHMYGDDTIKQV